MSDAPELSKAGGVEAIDQWYADWCLENDRNGDLVTLTAHEGQHLMAYALGRYLDEHAPSQTSPSEAASPTPGKCPHCLCPQVITVAASPVPASRPFDPDGDPRFPFFKDVPDAGHPAPQESIGELGAAGSEALGGFEFGTHSASPAPASLSAFIAHPPDALGQYCTACGYETCRCKTAARPVNAESREIAAACYQLAGVVGFVLSEHGAKNIPVRILDSLSAASDGKPFVNFLPISPDEFEYATNEASYAASQLVANAESLRFEELEKVKQLRILIAEGSLFQKQQAKSELATFKEGYQAGAASPDEEWEVNIHAQLDSIGAPRTDMNGNPFGINGRFAYIRAGAASSQPGWPWVYVSQRLPTEAECADDQSDFIIATEQGYVFQCSRDKNLRGEWGWFDAYDNPQEQVIAWFQLPAPPSHKVEAAKREDK